jgi:hypothetical protein
MCHIKTLNNDLPYTLVRMARIQSIDTIYWQTSGAQELLFSTGGDAKWYRHFGGHFGGFL